MQQLPWYVKCDSSGTPFMCRLKKTLYGLRQAPRAWFEKLKQFLNSIGFVGSKFDASLFVRTMSRSTLYVLMYVDDIIITGSLTTAIDWFVRLLNDEFSLKDMGDIHYFLGIEVLGPPGVYIYSVHMPMVSSSTLFKDDGERLKDPMKYRSLAGTLQYVVLTRLGIAYVVNRCDNSSAVAVAANPVLHSKFKHIELDLFFVREKVADGFDLVDEVPACDQMVDVFTKPLSVTSFTRFRNLFRVLPVGKIGEC
ncbi:Retrovirus-related Pol polyprotein from transposon TNT 1-94 [Gossypium australe]|uniref:Retrovirus-related Pol polyprotein from transposon TNT 1-94 n=1 Tax=Gossypium australe TaxID=47621 RepID=A0A5B6W4Q6_9ROSI|nr:Retrovirus-related Pol polyprotein from transposon TNT 1-94 [Gossypium australe]